MRRVNGRGAGRPPRGRPVPPRHGRARPRHPDRRRGRRRQVDGRLGGRPVPPRHGRARPGHPKRRWGLRGGWMPGPAAERDRGRAHRAPLPVMAGLDPAIQSSGGAGVGGWMVGSEAARSLPVMAGLDPAIQSGCGAGVARGSTGGSSPRARGTLARARLRGAGGRFIPACAGNTPATPSSVSATTVHPRVRGEHIQPPMVASAPGGSSPRARGTHLIADQGGRRRRFIPACAGNTARGAKRGHGPAVHPRVRGEHSRDCLVSGDGDGSSPRARGTLARLSGQWRWRRFIPACAGNTSPRARGTLCDYCVDACRGRFIPACAGNTAAITPSSSCAAVHPRVRGEHGNTCDYFGRLCGSSPRARGTPVGRRRGALASRFIPACAGNTR